MPAIDKFQSNQDGLSDPCDNAFAITPSDSTNFSYVTRGIYVGGAGNIAAVMLDGSVVTFVGAAAGTILPIRVSRVNLTNTTATNLVGIY